MSGTNSRAEAADLHRRVHADPRHHTLRSAADEARAAEARAKADHVQALRMVPYDREYKLAVAVSVEALTKAVAERKQAEAALDALWTEHRR